MTPLNILLLCNRPVKNADASTVTDHLDAFVNFSEHKVTQLSFIRHLPSQLDLSRFDAIIIHYTIAIGYLSDHYIDQEAKDRIRNFQGMKIVFIQDEYRSVQSVLETLRYLDIDMLFTCLPESEINKVYSEDELPDIIKINTLTGYVPKSLTEVSVPSIAERPIDVAYRTRKPPFWLGELAYEKWQIADHFNEYAKDKHLQLDISYDEADRIYGHQWVKFVSSTKTMLGVESGASVFDFTGGLQKKVDAYVAKHPDITFPEIQEKFLQPYEGLIYLNQISPRCFESAALRTVMILFEGAYSGILKPWKHYIPLKKDFSNFDEVLSVLKDNVFLQKMADRTFEEIALNPEYSYETFIKYFDASVVDAFNAKSIQRSGHYYTDFGYRFALAMSPRYAAKRFSTLTLQRILLGTKIRAIIFRMWGHIPFNIRNIVRPLLRMLGR